jgi:hypothetical protein
MRAKSSESENKAFVHSDVALLKGIQNTEKQDSGRGGVSSPKMVIEKPSLSVAMSLFFNPSFRSLFFFFSGTWLQSASLVGDELNEPKNSQLPSLRQNVAKRSMERRKSGKPEDYQVPSVRQRKKTLEKRNTPYSCWSNSTFLLQRLRLLLLRAVNPILKNPFFFSIHSARRFSS